MNIEKLQGTVKQLLVIADMDYLDIDFYHPAPANPPWEPTIRYMAWDCYGPAIAADQTEMQRYGSKAYYIDGNPLSVVWAERRLLMDIAITLKNHLIEDARAFAAMLEVIYGYPDKNLAALSDEASLSYWSLPTLA